MGTLGMHGGGMVMRGEVEGTGMEGAVVMRRPAGAKAATITGAAHLIHAPDQSAILMMLGLGAGNVKERT